VNVSGNSFNIQASPTVSVTGSVNPTTTVVTGTINTPSGTVSYSGISGATARTDRLLNLSSLGVVGTGQNVLVSGFIIGGSTSKPMVLRGVGPGLVPFGVAGTLANATLTLFNGSGQVIATNSGWGGGSTLAGLFAQVGAFPLAASSADSAIAMTLAPGAYTVQISGGGGTGKALIELYDATAEIQDQYQQLLNISSRALVNASSGPLTGGFIVAGNNSKQLLIRGVGPTLGQFGIAGALTDPVLTVYDSGGNVVAINRSWGTPLPVTTGQVVATAAAITAADGVVGAFALPAGSKDTAVIITLPPGAYSAQVTGNAGASGTAMVEIYELPAQ
jgi:hypothetical protein